MIIIIGHVNNIPSMQLITGISRNTQSKSHMILLTECVSGNPEIMHCGILINMPYWKSHLNWTMRCEIRQIQEEWFGVVILIYYLHSSVGYGCSRVKSIISCIPAYPGASCGVSIVIVGVKWIFKFFQITSAQNKKRLKGECIAYKHSHLKGSMNVNLGGS